MVMTIQQDVSVFEEKVTTYWPEFAKNGKGDLLVADVMRHEGGFPWIDKVFKWKDFSTESVKRNVVGKALEEDELHYPPSAYKTKREYHASNAINIVFLNH